VTGIAERLRASLADRYRIERELGAGGMATVYLAEDLKHKRIEGGKISEGRFVSDLLGLLRQLGATVHCPELQREGDPDRPQRRRRGQGP